MEGEESAPTSPELPSFSNNDLISRLIAQYKVSPHHGAILLLVFNLMLNCILAFVFNAWFPAVRVNGKVTGGLLTEVGAWTIDLIAQPIIFGTYIWLQNVGFEMFKQLVKDRRIIINP